MARATMVLASTFVAMAANPRFLAMAKNHPVFCQYILRYPLCTGILWDMPWVLSKYRAGVPCTIPNSELGYHVLSQIPSWDIVYIPGHVLVYSGPKFGTDRQHGRFQVSPC